MQIQLHVSATQGYHDDLPKLLHYTVVLCCPYV
jgi:hypothetical protein